MFWLALYCLGMVTGSAIASCRIGRESDYAHYTIYDLATAVSAGAFWPITLITYVPWAYGVSLRDKDREARRVMRKRQEALAELEAEGQDEVVKLLKGPGHAEICRCDLCKEETCHG